MVSLRQMAKFLQRGEPGSFLIFSCSLCLVFVLSEYVVLRENKLKNKMKGTEMWILIFSYLWDVMLSESEAKVCSVFQWINLILD